MAKSLIAVFVLIFGIFVVSIACDSSSSTPPVVNPPVVTPPVVDPSVDLAAAKKALNNDVKELYAKVLYETDAYDALENTDPNFEVADRKVKVAWKNFGLKVKDYYNTYNEYPPAFIEIMVGEMDEDDFDPTDPESLAAALADILK
ncbi:MAG: hypothetical protein LBV68_03060 [Spirochaetaceae bacterium]|jgi:hypothetical protein|nr:hypothetical protein [Spirochaetaceae bacterium]